MTHEEIHVGAHWRGRHQHPARDGGQRSVRLQAGAVGGAPPGQRDPVVAAVGMGGGGVAAATVTGERKACAPLR